MIRAARFLPASLRSALHRAVIPRTFFDDVFGFREDTEFMSPGGYARTQARFTFDPRSGVLVSLANNRSYSTGHFSTPTLADLRREATLLLSRTASDSSRCSLDHIAVADIRTVHARHPGALFQAASQFNCLEMVSPEVTPEDGISIYAMDKTQGPACSIACAPGTVVRNYFVDVGVHAHPSARVARGELGQRARRQVNNLDGVAAALQALRPTPSQHEDPPWAVVNGYVLVLDRQALLDANATLAAHKTAVGDALKIGLHADTEVVAAVADGSSSESSTRRPVTVSQAYCAAVPMAAGDSIVYELGTLADVVLAVRIVVWGSLSSTAACPAHPLLRQATYEATLWAAVLNSQRTGCHDVFLTFVGGGVFRNPGSLIESALGRAVSTVARAGATLRVHVCHHEAVDTARAQCINAILAPEVILRPGSV